MDDIREQQEMSDEISEAISRPIGTNDIDEDDMEAQLKELEQQVCRILGLTKRANFTANAGTRRTRTQRTRHRSEAARSADRLTQSTTDCAEEAGGGGAGQIGSVVNQLNSFRHPFSPVACFLL